MTQSIEEIVVGLIARHKGLDPVTVSPGAALADLGVTSLDAITLAYELEEALGVEIPNADIESLRTVQDLIDGLHRLTAAKG
jgi:acyl carrier protein